MRSYQNDKKCDTMNSSDNNMCNKCSIKQDCCRILSWLRLSEIEYKQHFAKHSANLEVIQDGRLFMVSAKDGYSCPNWIGDQCTIYADRPMECRLFPYTMGQIIHIGNRVNIPFHSRTECPKKKILLMPKTEANRMIWSFSRRAFRDADKINIEYESFIFKLKYKIREFIWRLSKKF
jgi:Fe-S-cluster containining protein